MASYRIREEFEPRRRSRTPYTQPWFRVEVKRRWFSLWETIWRGATLDSAKAAVSADKKRHAARPYSRVVWEGQ